MQFHGCPLFAEVAQLAERNLAKVEVAGSNPVFRSIILFISLLLIYFVLYTIFVYISGICGVSIMVIMPVFQTGYVGSIPIRRSILMA